MILIEVLGLRLLVGLLVISSGGWLMNARVIEMCCCLLLESWLGVLWSLVERLVRCRMFGILVRILCWFLLVLFLGDVCVVHELRHDEVRWLLVVVGDFVIERIVRVFLSLFVFGLDDVLVCVVWIGWLEILEDAVVFGLEVMLEGCVMVVLLKARGCIIGAFVFVWFDVV